LLETICDFFCPVLPGGLVVGDCLNGAFVGGLLYLGQFGVQGDRGNRKVVEFQSSFSCTGALFFQYISLSLVLFSTWLWARAADLCPSNDGLAAANFFSSLC
jgi:hypothetical protein